MLNENHTHINHIWELEANCSLSDIEEFCTANASKYVYDLNQGGTVRFEWYIGKDNKTVTFIEGFKNEAAAKERIKNHMESHLMVKFPEVFDVKKLTILGEIGPELAETCAAF